MRIRIFFNIKFSSMCNNVVLVGFTVCSELEVSWIFQKFG